MGDATPSPTPGADEPATDSPSPTVDETTPTPAAIVEAILFVGHPENQLLSNRLIAGYLRGVSPSEVDDLVVQLNAAYDQQDAPYRIVSEGAGYRLALRPDFSRLRERFYGRVRQARLSQAAIDLLAIVAYHQPIARDEIDRLRGTASSAVLRQLVRRELLSIERSTQKPIRPFYRTTDRFLDLFGLRSLDDLPRHEDFLRD
jgi:segregation and condensation protein B